VKRLNRRSVCPSTQQYEQADAAMEPTYNEAESRYEFGYPDQLPSGPYSRPYSKKGNLEGNFATFVLSAKKPYEQGNPVSAVPQAGPPVR